MGGYYCWVEFTNLKWSPTSFEGYPLPASKMVHFSFHGRDAEAIALGLKRLQDKYPFNTLLEYSCAGVRYVRW